LNIWESAVRTTGDASAKLFTIEVSAMNIRGVTKSKMRKTEKSFNLHSTWILCMMLPTCMYTLAGAEQQLRVTNQAGDAPKKLSHMRILS
jgi:hypothetical protein